MSVIVANAGTLSIGGLRVTTAASRKVGSAAMVGICWSRAILPMPTMAIGTGFEGIWVPVSGLSGPAVDSGGIIGDDLFDQDEDVVDQVAHCMFGLVGLAGGDRFVNGGVVVDAGRAAGDAIGEADRGAQRGIQDRKSTRRNSSH